MQAIRTLKIINELGLHARAAAKTVELAKRYHSQLYFRKGEQEVDGTSILAILTLACAKGTEIQVRVVGEDSEELMEKISELFEQRFGERK